jgi:hypothetical protein
MFGDFLTLEPDRHEILPDGAWVKKVREIVRNENVFVYRHRVEKDTFVVCEWMDKPHTCTELFIIDAPPDHSPTNMPSMPEIVHRCRPMTEMFSERHEKHVEKRYEEAAAGAETTQQRLEAAAWLEKQGMDEAAYAHREGCQPYAAAGESLGLMEDTISQLNSMASSKVISTGGDEKKPKHKM